MSRYSIVIFGFTGYTGKYIFEEVYRQSKKEKITFAVAGRSADKIRDGLEDSATYLEDDYVKNTPVIIANVNDEKSLAGMAKQAVVLLNCVGPYRFYGEIVVKACIENGTHHLDISGEPQYLETMQLRYHKEAESKGVYVVGACGFDSIPPEIGLKFITNQFKGAINDVEYYIADNTSDDMKIHFGTWESYIYGFAHRKELPLLRKQLFPQGLPKGKYPPPTRSLLFYSDELKRWCLPCPSFDKAVVTRSQHYLHFEKGIKPIQFVPFITFPSLFLTLFTMFIGGIFALFSNFGFSRTLLLKFPRFFSGGIVSFEGASRKAIENSKMELILIGRGWSSTSAVDVEKPNRKIICSISGPESGYLSCSIFIVQAGITILKEQSKMPGNGGVYSPLAAFNDTTYLERLQRNEINFAKVSDTSVQ